MLFQNFLKFLLVYFLRIIRSQQNAAFQNNLLFQLMDAIQDQKDQSRDSDWYCGIDDPCNHQQGGGQQTCEISCPVGVSGIMCAPNSQGAKYCHCSGSDNPSQLNTCPTGQSFDTDVGNCNWDWANPPICGADEATTATPIDPYSWYCGIDTDCTEATCDIYCPIGVSGYFCDENDPARYCHCTGTESPSGYHTCGGGNHFNPQYNICDHPNSAALVQSQCQALPVPPTVPQTCSAGDIFNEDGYCMPLDTCNDCGNGCESGEFSPGIFAQESIELTQTTHATFPDVTWPNSDSGIYIEFYLYIRDTSLQTFDSPQWANIIHFGANNVMRYPTVWAWGNPNSYINKLSVIWRQYKPSGGLEKTEVTFSNIIESCQRYHFVIRVNQTFLDVKLNDEQKTASFAHFEGGLPEPNLGEKVQLKHNDPVPFHAPLHVTGTNYVEQPIDALIKGFRFMSQDCASCACTIEDNEFDPDNGFLAHPSSYANCPNMYSQCLSNPCLAPGSVCVDSADFLSYTCDCPYLYSGDNCEIFQVPCDFENQPCQNGGNCTNINDDTAYSCTCAAGFTNTNCETAVPCFSEPCKNNGTCENEPDYSDFDCDCPLGWIGDTCDQYFPCELNPCQNGATCQNVVNTNNPDVFLYECNCDAGYAGVDCELDIPCFSDPCINSGTCSSVGQRDGIYRKSRGISRPVPSKEGTGRDGFEILHKSYPATHFLLTFCVFLSYVAFEIT